jgi:hypothetical protein
MKGICLYELNIFRLFLRIYFSEFQGHKLYYYKPIKALVSVNINVLVHHVTGRLSKFKKGKRVVGTSKKYC